MTKKMILIIAIFTTILFYINMLFGVMLQDTSFIGLAIINLITAKWLIERWEKL